MLPQLPQSNIIIIDKLQRTAMNATLCHQRDQCFGAPLKTARKIESTHTTTKKKRKLNGAVNKLQHFVCLFKLCVAFFTYLFGTFSPLRIVVSIVVVFFLPKGNGNKVSASAVGCDKT